jgi:hypothetical protein
VDSLLKRWKSTFPWPWGILFYFILFYLFFMPIFPSNSKLPFVMVRDGPKGGWWGVMVPPRPTPPTKKKKKEKKKERKKKEKRKKKKKEAYLGSFLKKLFCDGPFKKNIQYSPAPHELNA